MTGGSGSAMHSDLPKPAELTPALLAVIAERVLQHLGEHNCNVRTIAALATTCKATRDVAAPRLASLRQLWLGWFGRAAKPPGLAAGTASSIDQRLLRFIVSGRTEINFNNLDSNGRKHVHWRCEELGLHGRTTTRLPRSNQGHMTVSRPPAWRQPDLRATPPPPQPPPPQPQLTQRQLRRKKMEEWFASCDECGRDLDVDTAMYHHSGMGPLCEACIEADPELEGLKWEPRCSFWYN
ncbi:hypothetical protein HYH02_007313 [Chlamydomonas schloesseri]|uniref:Uncharacterized protein n=1 Tax=Chlamydomonas schloesseri TaxID=2026947 RepID=A0A835WI81_9CHLO|nr:hypothetical protein HYH02_007313 [Chlamydomonas schloesseri]|eukprot:KAG2447857.1 hypothetical protein HYH02_007313 [Chlamydomonas schloesseri]